MRIQLLGRVLAVGLAVHVFVFVGAFSARAETTIGIYRDERGSSCSFSNNDPGIVDAYVVIRPDARGARAVRFSAPVPACFGGVWVQDIVPDRMHTIGESGTGISVSSSWCEDAPITVLQIRYFQNGSTTPCCEYPVLPDPFVGMIETIDCNFESYVSTGTTSYFNANQTCLCGFNVPPNPPFNPAPPDADPAAAVSTVLSWSATDPDSNLQSFDVYLGTTDPPGLLVANHPQTSYQPAQLSELTTYYWRVVARDDWGVTASGSTWTFTTRLTNSPPGEPVAAWPVSGSTGILPTAQLVWQCTDVDEEPLVYDVYFGTGSPPPLAASDIAVNQYTPSLTWDTYYYWRIVARDPQGHETTGPVWGFRTRPENWPPEIPSNPSPANGATGEPVGAGSLTWTCSDKDAGDVLVYDVYFGTTNPPPQVAAERTTRTYPHGTLSPATTYYWRIVARDNHGAESSGATWSFTTWPNLAPAPPSSPSPANQATDIALVTALTWQCSDPNGDVLKYEVYFGTSTVPPLVTSNLSFKTYSPGTLAFSTTYYWRIVARDPFGAATPGPTWSFTTKGDGAPPAASSPSPANQATNVPLVPTLTWVCTDPDGEQLTFDVYFGTSVTPPVFASNIPTKSFAPGPLAPTTRYYWRIVARDPANHESASPTWYFTTRANSAPSTPSSPSPANNGQANAAPTLTWSAADPDGQPLTYTVYFGDTSPPPLAASGLITRSFAPGVLAVPKRYYWQVVVSDGVASTTGAIWSFTAVSSGDANGDGQITTADAKCAMDRYLFLPGCGSDITADVDCSNAVTPRDARCIHRRAAGMECTFCGETPASPAAAGTPGIGVLNTWEWNDTLYCRLGVWNVPSFESFGFDVMSGATFIRAQRRGITNDFVTVRSVPSVYPGYVPARVGGYSLTGAPTAPSTASEFIDLRFLRTPYSYWVRIENYADGLAGAPILEFNLPEPQIPVLITRFDASPRRNGVALSWQLESDEAMDAFTIHRREGSSPPVVIAQGRVDETRGSYFDASVTAGTTYEYDLVVRSTGGDEFRSQVRRVTVAPLALELGANHPNPFNPQTTIPYVIPAGGGAVRVRLAIYDTSGHLVRVLVDENQAGGARNVVWRGEGADGRTVTSGVYFAVLTAGKERLTRKLVLLK